MYKNSKIIIVDDEEMLLKTLKTLLTLEGYSDVNCFEEPQTAIDYIKVNTPDIVFSDFCMPKMNGIEFLNEVKKMYPDVTEILLTGYADKENAIKAINELQIYKYIEKPFKNEDFLINLKNGIERSHLKKQIQQKIDELENLNKNLEKTVELRTKDLAKTNLKLSTIIKNCADGIVIFDDDYKITLANEAIVNMFQIDLKEILNKNFFELVINEKNQKFYEDLENKKNIFLKDFCLIDYKNEKKIPVEINISSVYENENKFFIASIRDVSMQKENEILRDDFIATLTHDLRTPLLAAISGLDFILDKKMGDITEKQQLMLETMKRSNGDMLGLVNALLEVYRYESGKLFLSKTKFSFPRLIDDVIFELKPLIDEKAIKIEKDYTLDENFTINADRREIKRVILNLLSNAISYSSDSSKIIVRVILKDKDIQMEIQDFGTGLDDEDKEKLFKRFSQGTSKKRACSTGLGLYLSRQIVEAHNGKIYVNSALNEGSTFGFILKSAILENKVLL